MIKFEYGAGAINFNEGYSPINGIFGISALSMTAKQDSNGAVVYATDREGLEEASNQAYSTIDFLNNSIAGISNLLGHAITLDGRAIGLKFRQSPEANNRCSTRPSSV